MAKTPDKKDPEGTDSMSKKELDDKVDAVVRELLGQSQKPPTGDPEGTEKP